MEANLPLMVARAVVAKEQASKGKTLHNPRQGQQADLQTLGHC
jgi:hypothetical protein